MKLPRNIARFNKRVTNRVQGLWAPYLPPWAVIVHRGRTSGTIYRTPVLAAVRSGQLIVALIYGQDADWVRNLVAAGEGSIVRLGRTRRISEVTVIDSSRRQSLPGARWMARLGEGVLVARLD